MGMRSLGSGSGTLGDVSAAGGHSDSEELASGRVSDNSGSTEAGGRLGGEVAAKCAPSDGGRSTMRNFGTGEESIEEIG